MSEALAALCAMAPPVGLLTGIIVSLWWASYRPPISESTCYRMNVPYSLLDVPRKNGR